VSEPQRPQRRLDAYVHGTLDQAELAKLIDACALTVDALGTFCPEPLIRTQNAMAGLATGDIAMILADDAGIELDLPAWCISTKNEYLGVLREERQLRAFIRRAQGAHQP
jgi:tRNA 2-thiouridine synthesizing protein A